MNYKQKRQEKLERQVQRSYAAVSQLQKEKELGVMCLKYGITKEDLFCLVDLKRRLNRDDK